MNSIKDPTYRPILSERTRVRLIKREHHEYSRPATLVRALPNPSGRPGNQRYDVRFDDGVYGRFLERYLERVDSEGTEIKGGGQASAA